MKAKGSLISLAFFGSESPLARPPEIRTFRPFANRLRPLRAWGFTVPGAIPPKAGPPSLFKAMGALNGRRGLYFEGPHAIL